ncbi:hypothetical protein SDRG_16055 [Saprolegnia diclina VS20]|uniref:Uncharacterized protein n=1 Tax=Saprolegnia diclina (strain VS20) TaxID=1156394 RepID=T0PYG4_SAPDV|nr:hypothetical protein SDRG_16055 [Saprolegnia diclina VS20]EQC26105.1 hypothetical protein SDRG_16055 [Saprolegnia diclina VS20]|eukprot:XP_008620472.1 hypothetical protein SDRG_16055 [Saprolegnia diclina VS20]
MAKAGSPSDDLVSPALMAVAAIMLPVLTWTLLPFEDDALDGADWTSPKAYLAFHDKVGPALSVVAAAESVLLGVALTMTFKHFIMYRLHGDGIPLAAVDIANKDPIQASVQCLRAPGSAASGLAVLLFASMLATVLDNVVFQWEQSSMLSLSPFTAAIRVRDTSALAPGFFPLVDGSGSGDLYAAQTPLTAWAFSAGISAVATMNKACLPGLGCGLTNGNATHPLLACDASSVSCTAKDIPIFGGYTIDCASSPPRKDPAAYAVTSLVDFSYDPSAFSMRESVPSALSPPSLWWNLTLQRPGSVQAVGCKVVPAWTVRAENSSTGCLTERVVYAYNATLSSAKIRALQADDPRAFVVQNGLPFVFHQFGYAANFLTWFFNTTCRMGDTGGHGVTGSSALYCDEASGLPVLTSVKHALSINTPTAGIESAAFLAQEMTYVLEMLYRPIWAAQTLQAGNTIACDKCAVGIARVARRTSIMLVVCLVNGLTLALVLVSLYISLRKRFPKSSLYASDVARLAADRQEVGHLDQYQDAFSARPLEADVS